MYEQTAPEIQGTQSFGILADALLENFHNVYLYRYSHGSESFALQASEYILSLCSSEGHKLQYMFPSHQEPVCLTRGFIQNCFLRNDHASRLANVRPKTELHQKISEVRALDQAPHTSSHVESRRITRNHANFCLRARFRKSNHAQSRSIT